MNRTELPAPLYAAAGAGDLAYQKLREAATRTAGQLRQRVVVRDRDLAKLRESAQRGRTLVVERAAAVQDRAVAGYRRLVAHGERVVAERAAGAEPADKPNIEVEVGPVEGADRAGPGGTADG